VPGAAGQPHTTITEAGHFVTEDKPREFADILNGFVAAS
jgi:haloalkane dehalogenase